VNAVDERSQREVLSAISDDYERVEQIADYLRKSAPEMDPCRRNISTALADLIRQGFARAYLLSSQPPHVTEVAFDGSRIDESYFYVMPEGKQLVLTRTLKLETFPKEQRIGHLPARSHR
jgi:hypothetical protein